jgi:hypothetical protein
VITFFIFDLFLFIVSSREESHAAPCKGVAAKPPEPEIRRGRSEEEGEIKKPPRNVITHQGITARKLKKAVSSVTL